MLTFDFTHLLTEIFELKRSVLAFNLLRHFYLPAVHDERLWCSYDAVDGSPPATLESLFVRKPRRIFRPMLSPCRSAAVLELA